MKIKQLRECLSYDDVFLVPQYSTICSRSHVSLKSYLDSSRYLEFPLIASPMDTVSEEEMALRLSQLGSLAIIHRFMTIEKQSQIIQNLRNIQKTSILAAAVGVNRDYLERAIALEKSGVDLICIDVAHADHLLMEVALSKLRNCLNPNIHIVAGTIATPEGFKRLSDNGANSVRVGVAGGSICETKINTGSGMPVFQSILDCQKFRKNSLKYANVKIIADGGCKNAGDVVKALAAGSDFIIAGSLFAGTKECPGNLIQDSSGKQFKIYRGMASKESQAEYKNNQYYSPEGIEILMPFRGSIIPIFETLTQNIKSGFSYSNAYNIKELQNNAVFARQTYFGFSEGKAHIVNRI